MKRFGNLFEKIISIENLQLADQLASKGKSKQPGVIMHNKNREENICKLQQILKTKTYTTSPYSKFFIYEPKEREISRLPYYPDRIVHHAIMNIMEKIFMSVFTRDTYSCIKGRGIKAAADGVKKALRDEPGTKYCLKLDIKKFYPNIDHDILKQLLRKKIKDPDLLWLLDEIIDSSPGLPIGNYLSQFFANFYLTYLDYFIKHVCRISNYFRYLDDMVIFASNKPQLHKILFEIKQYLLLNLKLEVKGNYQVFPVDDRGVDFVGYRFYHGYTLLRKSIKQNFARMIKRRRNDASIAAYNGWAAHCNSKKLLKKLLA